MTETERLLGDMGLTKTEAQIYLAGLSQGSLGIPDIAVTTKIKRPTIYHALATLEEKGMVVSQKTGRKLRYVMSPPEHIRGLISTQREVIEERVRKLDVLMPLLQTVGNTSPQTQVSQYAGVEGMKMVLDIAFNAKSKHWDIIAPVNNFLREYDKEYAQRYLKAREYHGITARTLWEFTSKGRELFPDEIEARNPRFMPAAMQGKFKSMMILFDDKIAIFSSYSGLSAVLVSSKELHAMFRAIFDTLWEFSERY